MTDENYIELASGVEVVTIPTALNFYPRNLLFEIYQFRERELKALNWTEGIYYLSALNGSAFTETDLQDNPATIYFTKSDRAGNIVGMVRLSPSVDANQKPISMLGTTMSHLVYEHSLPKESDVYEASRLVLDRAKLHTKELRAPVIDELLVATVLFAKQNNIKEFFGFMINKIWESTYERLGFALEQIGPDTRMNEDHPSSSYIVSARRIRFDAETIVKNAKVKANIINVGDNPKLKK